jgi:ABC-2 type transport system permease protein
MSTDAETESTVSETADDGTVRSDARSRSRQVVALAQREFTTLVRTRTYAALGLVFAVLVVGMPLLGSAGGFLPLVLDLLLPVEVLVPVLALAFGTWSVLADAERGELDVIRTYPVDRSTYVLGAYLGRATGLLVVVLVPLAVVGALAPTLGDPATSVLASHGTVDSPTYFARFIALVGGYALVTLAMAMAVSSVSRSRRQGLALAVVALLGVVVGFDLLVVAGVGQGVVGADTLPTVLAFSPPGAFRGLVLGTAAGGLVETGPPAANVAASALGLLGWLVCSLLVATLAVWSPVTEGRRV